LAQAKDETSKLKERLFKTELVAKQKEDELQKSENESYSL